MGFQYTKDQTTRSPLVATDRFSSHYVTTTGIWWATNALRVVPVVNSARVTVDGVALVGWESRACCETASVEVEDGTHIVASEALFGLTLSGEPTKSTRHASHSVRGRVSYLVRSSCGHETASKLR